MRLNSTILAVVAAAVGGAPVVHGNLPQDSKTITVELKFVESTARLEGAKEGVLTALLLEMEAKALREKLSKDDKSRFIHTPTISLVDGRRGSIFLGDRIPHTTGFQVEIDKDGKPSVAPISKLEMIGTQVILTACARDGVAFDEFEVTLTEQRRKPGEMKRIATPHGEIVDHELQTFKYKLRSSVKEGEILLIGPLEKPWCGKEDPKLWILVTAKVIGNAGPSK